MTMLEKAKEMGLTIMVSNDGLQFALGCPYEHGLSDRASDEAICMEVLCGQCYAREYVEHKFLDEAMEQGHKIVKARDGRFAELCPNCYGLEGREESEEACKHFSGNCILCYDRVYPPAPRPSEHSEESSSPEPKDDSGKPRLDLVPMRILYDIAEVREYGNAKYGDPDNWKKVEVRRYLAALLRHIIPMVEDINAVDPESGIAHRKHAACNLAFISALLEGK